MRGDVTGTDRNKASPAEQAAGENTTPVANTDVARVRLGEATIIDVLANDTDAENESDSFVDVITNPAATGIRALFDLFAGDFYSSFVLDPLENDTTSGVSPLILTHINGRSIEVGQTVRLGGGDEVFLNPDQTLTYVSNTLDRGSHSSESFTYTVEADGLSDTSSVRVEFATSNNTPIINSDYFVGTIGVPVILDVLANDIDAENDELTVVRVGDDFISQPITTGETVDIGYALITLNADQSLTFVSTVEDEGQIRFLSVGYYISDGFSQNGTISYISLHPSNYAPEPATDNYRFTASDAIALEVLANDLDRDEDPLSIIAINGQSISPGQSIVFDRSIVTLNSDQTLSVDFTEGEFGYFNYWYTVSDGEHSADTFIFIEHQSIDTVPNNVTTTAAIDINSTVIGRIDGQRSDGSADSDWYIVELQADEVYEFYVQATGDLSLGATQMFLRDASGSIVPTPTAEPIAGIVGTVRPEIDGIYYIEVVTPNPSSFGDFELLVTGPDPEADFTQIIATEQREVLQGGDDANAFTFAPGTSDKDALDVIANWQPGDVIDLSGLSLSESDIEVRTVSSGTVLKLIEGFGSDDFQVRVNLNGNSAEDVLDSIIYDGGSPPPPPPPPPTAPDAEDDSGSTTIGTSTVISVLANDSDVNGDELTLVSTSDPANGSASLTGNGNIQYTPDAGFVGTDTFTYTVSDGGLTSQATVSVSVTDPGAFNVISASAGKETLTGTSAADAFVFAPGTSDKDALDVIANWQPGDVIDLSGLGLSESDIEVRTVSGGTVLKLIEGFGSDDFQVRVNLNGNSAEDVLDSIIYDGGSPPPPENSAPTANEDDAETVANTAIAVSVLANDTDPENDLLSIDGFGQGANGTVLDLGNGALEYTPALDFVGTDSFTYTVTDGELTAQASVNIDVTASPPPPLENTSPTANDDNAETVSDTAVAVFALMNDTDPENDVLVIETTSQGSNGSVAILGNSILEYTPASGFVGTDSFTYTVTDGEWTSQATVFVDVTVPPSPSDFNVVSAAIGQESLEGTEGADAFTFTPGTSVNGAIDTVLDWAPGDVIDLSGLGLSADDVEVRLIGGGSILKLIQGFGGDEFHVKINLNGNSQEDVLASIIYDSTNPPPPLNTILGTDEDDLLLGTPENDLIQAGDGMDRLEGFDGDDVLEGGPGGDLLIGGPGNDTLRGGEGFNDIEPGLGNDIVDGSNGLTFVIYSELPIGDMDVNLEIGTATYADLAGTIYIDQLISVTSVTAGSGNDTLRARNVGSELIGGPGDDTLFGSDGSDGLFGSDGNDIIFGGLDEDSIIAGNGDDIVSAGPGRDSVSLGAGADILIAAPGDGPTSVVATLTADGIVDQFSPSEDRIDVTAFGLSASSALNLVSQTDNGAELNFGNGDVITLSLTDATLLTEVNFIGVTTPPPNDYNIVSASIGQENLVGTDGADAFTFAPGTSINGAIDAITNWAPGDIIDLTALGLTEDDVQIRAIGTSVLKLVEGFGDGEFHLRIELGENEINQVLGSIVYASTAASMSSDIQPEPFVEEGEDMELSTLSVMSELFEAANLQAQQTASDETFWSGGNSADLAGRQVLLTMDSAMQDYHQMHGLLQEQTDWDFV